MSRENGLGFGTIGQGSKRIEETYRVSVLRGRLIGPYFGK